MCVTFLEMVTYPSKQLFFTHIWRPGSNVLHINEVPSLFSTTINLVNIPGIQELATTYFLK